MYCYMFIIILICAIIFTALYLLNKNTKKKYKKSMALMDEKKIIDISTPVTNIKLVKLIREFYKSKSNEFRDKILFEIVINANFIMPVDFKTDLDKTSINYTPPTENNFLYLLALPNKENKNLCVAFTDWIELHKWKSSVNQKAMVLSFDDYVSFIEKRKGFEGIIINPFGESIILNKTMINDLKKWRDTQIISINN